MKQADFKPTQEMVAAATAVLEARAFRDLIRPIVVKYQTDILKRHQFVIDSEHVDDVNPGRVILDPDESYLLSESDFDVYLSECKKARDAAGLKVKNDGFCPLLVAEELLRKAERSLADAMEPVTDLNADKVLCSKNALSNYQTYIDLSLRLLVPYITIAPRKKTVETNYRSSRRGLRKKR